jgi:hypothetical protein
MCSEQLELECQSTENVLRKGFYLSSFIWRHVKKQSRFCIGKCKKILVFDFKILLQHLFGVTEETREDFTLDSRFASRNLTQDFRNTKHEVWRFRSSVGNRVKILI